MGPAEIQQHLEQALQRIQVLEEQMSTIKDSSRWKHLVLRPHPWRKQLSLKDRKMTVGQLMSVIVPNRFTPEQAGEELDLPVEAVREALAYYDENRELIEREAAEERRYLAERGYALNSRDPFLLGTNTKSRGPAPISVRESP